MKLNHVFFLWMCFCICNNLHSQSKYEYFLTGNGNLYFPRHSDKGMYPILGYDKEVSPKVLVGGFGFGFSALKQFKSKASIKVQSNISRSVYWESFTLVSDQSYVIGGLTASSTDYTLGMTGTIHYHPTKMFSIGTGVGIRAMILSALYLRDKDLVHHEKRFLGYNRYYKSLMPVIPLEFSLKFKKILINIRYEHGLLNRLKKDIAEYKKDRYGLLFFELGFQIK